MTQQKTTEHTRKGETKPQQSAITTLLHESAASTYEDIMAIVEAKIELLKIEMTEKIALVGASVVVAVILVIGAGYLITTLALLVGELTGHTFLGYLLVSIIFLSCFLFLTKFRPLLLKNLIQKSLLSLHDYTK